MSGSLFEEDKPIAPGTDAPLADRMWNSVASKDLAAQLGEN